MGTIITGLKISGGAIVGKRTFASIPGLMLDLDSDSRLVLSGSNLVTWTDRASSLVFTRSGTITKSGNYVVLDSGTLNCISIPLDFTFAYNASPRGLYFFGEIGGSGATRTILSTSRADKTAQSQYRTVNSSGNSRLGYTQMTTPTFTATGNLTHDALKCWSFVFGENNTTNNVKLYENNGLVGQTTRNYGGSPNALGVISRIRISAASAGNSLKIRRLLFYNWAGYTNTDVANFHSEIKEIFNDIYGSIF